MKKVLLSALALSAALISNGQGISKGSSTESGWAYDSFDSVTPVNDATLNDFGVFLWADTTNTETPYIIAFEEKTDGVFKSTKTRNGDGKVSYVFSQPYGLYNPEIGVSFGTGYTLDLSANDAKDLKVKVGLKFDLSTFPAKGLKFKFGIKDAGDALIDSKGANGGTGDQWKDEMYINVSNTGVVTVPAAMAETILIDQTTETDVTYITVDFKGAYQALYTDIDVAEESCPKFLPANTSFDPAKVVGFQMTVVAATSVAADCYLPETLTDVKLDLTSFSIGDLTQSVEDEKLFASKGFIAYPNPAKGGVVKFSTSAENVKVYDVVGNVVFSANSASEINVDSFNKGLYVVKSSKGATRFVVE